MGLIGPNGAGKTTFFNLLTGYIQPSAGKVTFEGKDITGKQPHSVAARGMIRSFQQDNVFADFTVLREPACWRLTSIPASTSGRRFSARRAPARRRAPSERGPRRYWNWWASAAWPMCTAGSLPHGHKRMLGIAMALACEPKLLLLDEPLAGMNIAEVDETIDLVRRLWEGGLTRPSRSSTTCGRP